MIDLEALRRVAPPGDVWTCIDDPELDPARLVAWREGSEDEEVVLHLGRCAACRAFVEALAPASEAQVEATLARLQAQAVTEVERSSTLGGRPAPPARPGSRWGWLRWSPLAAAAAGLLGWWFWPPKALPGWVADDPTGAQRTELSSTAPSAHVYAREGELQWMIRASTHTEGAVARAARWSVHGWRPLPGQYLEVETTGTVVLQGPARELLRPGPNRLRVVVGKRKASVDEALTQNRPSEEAVRVFEVEVELQALVLAGPCMDRQPGACPDT